MNILRSIAATLLIAACCCSFAASEAKAQSSPVPVFPPSNPADCTGGAVLTWDGSGGVKCTHVPTCAQGSVMKFVASTLTFVCEAAMTQPCPAGYSLEYGSMPGFGKFTCNPLPGTPGGPVIADFSVAMSANDPQHCIPSGLPNGQTNIGGPTTITPFVMSCGQTSGYDKNCCSNEGKWHNYGDGIDPWGTLRRAGVAVGPGSSQYFECLCL